MTKGGLVSKLGIGLIAGSMFFGAGKSEGSMRINFTAESGGISPESVIATTTFGQNGLDGGDDELYDSPNYPNAWISASSRVDGDANTPYDVNSRPSNFLSNPGDSIRIYFNGEVGGPNDSDPNVTMSSTSNRVQFSFYNSGLPGDTLLSGENVWYKLYNQNGALVEKGNVQDRIDNNGGRTENSFDISSIHQNESGGWMDVYYAEPTPQYTVTVTSEVDGLTGVGNPTGAGVYDEGSSVTSSVPTTVYSPTNSLIRYVGPWPRFGGGE